MLYKSTQTTVQTVQTPKDWLSKTMSEWESKNFRWQALSYFTLRILNTLRITFNYFKTRGELFYFLIGLGFIFSLAYYYKSNISATFPFLSDSYLKPIFQFLAFTTIGLSAVELFKEVFKDLFTHLLPRNEKNVIITEPPTFAQDQFVSIFSSVV